MLLAIQFCTNQSLHIPDQLITHLQVELLKKVPQNLKTMRKANF